MKRLVLALTTVALMLPADAFARGVFDPTVTTLGEWRARFELEASLSWHAGLLPDKQPV